MCYLSKLESTFIYVNFFSASHLNHTTSWDKVVVDDDGDIKQFSSPVCISFDSICMHVHEQREKQLNWLAECGFDFELINGILHIKKCMGALEIALTKIYASNSRHSLIRLSIIISNYGVCVCV